MSKGGSGGVRGGLCMMGREKGSGIALPREMGRTWHPITSKVSITVVGIFYITRTLLAGEF